MKYVRSTYKPRHKPKSKTHRVTVEKPVFSHSDYRRHFEKKIKALTLIENVAKK
jgi:hypothetical protein